MARVDPYLAMAVLAATALGAGSYLLKGGVPDSVKRYYYTRDAESKGTQHSSNQKKQDQNYPFQQQQQYQYPNQQQYQQPNQSYQQPNQGYQYPTQQYPTNQPQQQYQYPPSQDYKDPYTPNGDNQENWMTMDDSKWQKPQSNQKDNYW